MEFSATDCFRLSGIKLRRSLFECHTDIDEISFDDEPQIQSKRTVDYELDDADDSVAAMLHAYIQFGVRLIKREAKGLEPKSLPDDSIIYTVEADFLVSFDVKSREFTENDIADFAQFNVAHITWPFWREHVFSVLRNASLPLVPIPLLAGRRKNKKRIETKSE